MSDSPADSLWNFPVDLIQPKGSYHFSSDALLLAQCAAEYCVQDLKKQTVPISLADLGTGCGAVALSFLLRTRAVAAALEVLPELSKAAEENAHRLGLAEKMIVLQGDIGDKGFLVKVRLTSSKVFPTCFEKGTPALFDIVTCNPPWMKEGEGRVPPSELRKKALFSGNDSFCQFFRAADFLLKDRGMLFVVSSAERLGELFMSLPKRLNPEYLRLIFPQGKDQAVFAIAAARKNGRAKLSAEKKCL